MKTLQKILSAHAKKLRQTILLMHAEADEEVVHDFRVEFKKMRAVIRLAGKIKIPASLKVLYATAGKVREMQLLQKKILQLHTKEKLPIYFSRLNNQLAKAVSALKEKTAVNYNEEIKLLVAGCPEIISAQRVEHFIKAKEKAFTKIIRLPQKKEEDIHDVRKIVKDLLYCLRTLEQLNKKELLQSSGYNIDHLHQLSDTLGLFQDWCTLLSYLSLPSFRSLPEKEKQLLKKIRTALLKTKKEAKTLILSQLNDTVSLFQHNGG